MAGKSETTKWREKVKPPTIYARCTIVNPNMRRIFSTIRTLRVCCQTYTHNIPQNIPTTNARDGGNSELPVMLHKLTAADVATIAKNVKEDPPPLLGQIRALRSENARLRDEIRWLKMIDDPKVLDMPAE